MRHSAGGYGLSAKIVLISVCQDIAESDSRKANRLSIRQGNMKTDAKHRNYHFVCKEIVFERVNRRGLQFAVGSDNRVTFGNLSFLTPTLVVHFFHGITPLRCQLFPECPPLASPIGASGGGRNRVNGDQVGKATGKCFSETIGITTFVYDTFFPRMLRQNSTMISYKLVERVFSPKLQFL